MRAALFILLILFSNPAFGQSTEEVAIDAEPEIRAFLEPDSDIYVGQLIRLWIEISTPTRFSKAPNYPELLIDGAIVLLPDQFGVNTSSSQGGKTRVGQRQRYAIIPQHEGTFIVPPIKIPFGIMINGKASDPIILQTKPLELTAAFPPGMENAKQILSTKEFSINETYDRETTDLKVGDAITRTVTLHGENTFALALPTLNFEPVKGTRIYLAQSVLTNKTNRGQYSGTRIDAGTYVLEQAGDVVLPEIKVQWWNPESKTIESTLLPSLEFQVAKNPNFQNPGSISPESKNLAEKLKQGVASFLAWLWDNIVMLSLAAFGIYVVMMAWQRFGKPMIERVQTWHQRRLVSEPHYFREFHRACNTNDETKIAQSFWRWVNSLSPDTKTIPTLSIAGLRDTEISPEDYFKQLGLSHYGNGSETKIDGQKFYQAMKAKRREIRSHRSTKPPLGKKATLNPQG
ncbi:MAG: BatD family protein [Rhizobiaceae bacterium]|nr:BatD family protein [Rhizobiaceae bacterium]